MAGELMTVSGHIEITPVVDNDSFQSDSKFGRRK